MASGWFGDSSKGSTLPLKIYTIISLAIGVAYIVMGAKNVDGCPADPMIPTYLIVMGVFIIVASLWRLLVNFCIVNFVDALKTFTIVIFVLIGLASLAWFIAGNVFVYRLKDKYEPEDVKAANFCKHGFYLFAFWSLTANYITLGVIIIFQCCVHCCCKRN